jgi:4-hydroxybenzoate polyprenyltransferase
MDLVFALWMTTTIHLQEFHDINGDRSSGRSTLPLAFPPATVMRFRRATAVIFFVFAGSTIAWATTYFHEPHFYILLLACLVHGVGAVFVGIRVLLAHTDAMHERTYKIWYFLTAYALVFSMALFEKGR